MKAAFKARALMVARAITAGLMVGFSACGGGDDSKTSESPSGSPRAASRENRIGAPARPRAFFNSAKSAERFWTGEKIAQAEPRPLLTAPRAPISTAPPAPQGPEITVDGATGKAGNGTTPKPRSQLRRFSAREPGESVPWFRNVWAGPSTSAPADTEVLIKYTDPTAPKDKNEFTCTGTVVNTANKSVVWTAAHCVYWEGKYSTNISVAPGFQKGKRPYGVWPGRDANTTKAWQDGWKAKPPYKDLRYDLGAIVVGPNTAGKTLMDGIGGDAQGIKFNVGGEPLIDSFGYPSKPPFDGQQLIYCESAAAFHGSPTPTSKPPGPQTIGIGCDMNEGSSGGGWLSDYQSDKGWGYLRSVNSYYSFSRTSKLMFGPSGGDAARNLFEWAKSK